MDDRFRTSDADRDRVAGLLRDHFAVGRLTTEELDERLTAALSATTYGDLRRVLADLPGPGPALRRPDPRPPQAVPQWMPGRRGPRMLPLALLALGAVLLIPGAGWFFLAFFQAVLLLGLVACLAGVFLAGRFYRRVRRDLRSGYHHHHGHGWPGGYVRHEYGYWRS